MFCKVFFVKAWMPDRRRDEEIYCFDSDTCNNNHSKTICTEGYLHSHVTLFSTAFFFFFGLFTHLYYPCSNFMSYVKFWKAYWLAGVLVLYWLKDRLIRPWENTLQLFKIVRTLYTQSDFSYDLEKWFRLVFAICFISQWMKWSEDGLFVFPPKKTLIWKGHCSIGQSCCSMTSKRAFL